MIFKVLVIVWLIIISSNINDVAADIRKNTEALYHFMELIKEMRK